MREAPAVVHTNTRSSFGMMQQQQKLQQPRQSEVPDGSSSFQQHHQQHHQQQHHDSSLSSSSSWQAVDDHDDVTSKDRRDRRNRILLGMVLALALTLIAVDYSTDRHMEHACILFIDWVSEHPVQGVMAVILVYSVATILFIPGAILTIGCGFAFKSAFTDDDDDDGSGIAKGVAVASMAVFIGAFIGSLCSFLLGRYLFRDCVLRLASGYPILQAIDKALEQNGFKIMLLLRLSPLIPFNALDYISGVTSISFRDYALALFGIVPGTVLFCMVGATASSFTDAHSSSSSSGDQLARRLSLVAGLLFAIVGVTVASYYSKQELDKIINNADTTGESGGATSDQQQYLNIGPVYDDDDDVTEMEHFQDEPQQQQQQQQRL